MKLAYLVNQHPLPSHTFIRRELLALERRGHEIARFSIRQGRAAAGSADDERELRLTTVLLAPRAAAIARMALGAITCGLARPLRTLHALGTALRTIRRSNRGFVHHVAWWLEAMSLAHAMPRDTAHLHTHFATNGAMVAMLAAGIRGIPYSITVHGPDDLEQAPHLHLDEKVGRAAFVACISDYCRGQVARHCSAAHHGRLAVVRCGVEPGAADREPLPMPSGLRLAWVGRMVPQKGLEVLLEACSILRRQGLRFCVELLGNGPLEAEVRARIQALGLEGTVLARGWQPTDAVLATIDASSALLVPSHAEGIPVVIMEAFARGRPVISTSVAGVPELVSHGENGLLVPPADPAAFAAAVGEFAGLGASRWATMGSRGREDVRRLHDVERSVDRLERLFAGDHMP